MNLEEILAQIRALQEQKLNEVVFNEKIAIGKRIEELVSQAGDLRAIQIDPNFMAGHEGNSVNTLASRREYINGLRDAIKSPEFKQTGVSRK